MIAGYVGGRRAGSPIKAVIAALMPVFAIYIANITYAHNFASHQIDFVATLPMVVSDAAASILPFLLPYQELMVAYMQGFAQAVTTTFGMGTNGYLMVVIFAYIGGLIAEQTRRELGSRSGSGSSVGVNLVQPVIGARPYVDDEEQAYEEDEEDHRSRRPVRARSRGHAVIAPSGPRSAAKPRNARSSGSSSVRYGTTITRSSEVSTQPFYRTLLSSPQGLHVLSEVQLPHVSGAGEIALQFMRVRALVLREGRDDGEGRTIWEGETLRDPRPR